MAQRTSFGRSKRTSGDGRTSDVVSLRAERQRRHETVDAPKGSSLPLQAALVFGSIFAVVVAVGLAWPSIRSVVTDAMARQTCTIKGNLSEHGDIYHMPGDERYDETRIDESRGERWFCSAAEAEAAGWRRARPSRR